MARSLNKVMLIGNLGVDPEVRHTSSGLPVATFRMATSWTRGLRGGSARREHGMAQHRGLAKARRDLPAIPEEGEQGVHRRSHPDALVG